MGHGCCSTDVWWFQDNLEMFTQYYALIELVNWTVKRGHLLQRHFPAQAISLETNQGEGFQMGIRVFAVLAVSADVTSIQGECYEIDYSSLLSKCMSSSDCSTVTYLVNAWTNIVLLNRQKHRHQRFAIGIPTPWKWYARVTLCKKVREMRYNIKSVVSIQ